MAKIYIPGSFVLFGMFLFTISQISILKNSEKTFFYLY